MRKLSGKILSSFFHEVGSLTHFFVLTIRTFFRTQGNSKAIMAHLSTVFSRSFSTVLFAGVFVGAILVLQFNLMLKNFDAQIYLGGLNTSALVREIGPLIISFLLAGKIGAFTAAELGTMRVTEQIDAIECLGMNPIQYLVVPRMISIIVGSQFLLILGLIIGILGAMGIASLFCGVNFLQFSSSIPRFTGIWTLASGFFKSLVYGIIVAGVACYKGYTASGGARGVGRAVTQAAAYICFYIVIANFLTSYFLDFIHEFFNLLWGVHTA